MGYNNTDPDWVSEINSSSLILYHQAVLYLIVQVPCLVVSFGTVLGKQGLVVDFDQLPLRAIAEVSKKPISAQILKIRIKETVIDIAPVA